jgi:hypothetical protein
LILRNTLRAKEKHFVVNKSFFPAATYQSTYPNENSTAMAASDDGSYTTDENPHTKSVSSDIYLSSDDDNQLTDCDDDTDTSLQLQKVPLSICSNPNFNTAKN